MTIKILGPGCMNCKTLERRTIEALENLHIQAAIEKVEDVERIISYGILRTPGLVIDEKIVSQGSVPTVEKIKQLILAERERGPQQ
jgi:small redox-active disulfide protein 2